MRHYITFMRQKCDIYIVKRHFFATFQGFNATFMTCHIKNPFKNRAKLSADIFNKPII